MYIAEILKSTKIKETKQVREILSDLTADKK